MMMRKKEDHEFGDLFQSNDLDSHTDMEMSLQGFVMVDSGYVERDDGFGCDEVCAQQQQNQPLVPQFIRLGVGFEHLEHGSDCLQSPDGSTETIHELKL